MLSVISLPTGIYVKLKAWLISWQKVVFPVPGVPVTRIFGVLRWVVYSAIISIVVIL